MERGMSRGKRHHIWEKASVMESDKCHGKIQVLLRDIGVMERGQRFRKKEG